jgi:anhydro-N-acetylmuramic acid kinase
MSEIMSDLYNDLYIGLMSGTSADGIDAALVDFSQSQPTVVATYYSPYSATMRDKILALCQKGEDEIQRLGELDLLLGKAFAQAVGNLLKQQSLSSSAIKAIGSHGQSIRHLPHHPHRFTIQIGDPNIIAAETGITTVADFRRKDIAFGGQGAPLVPAFHQHVLASDQINRVIVNIGGIANITLLPQKNPGPIIGFDTGPGNVLLDGWINTDQRESHDKNGAWGAQGKVDSALLDRLLADHYFELPPPKSTGREHFNLVWLQKYLHAHGKTISPVDVQTTLVELTASSLLLGIRKYLQQGEILVCGGGAHNTFLMARLQALAGPTFMVDSTQKYGIDPDWVEAMAFAWLARQTLNRQPGNLPSVTGARQTAVLGGVYYGA